MIENDEEYEFMKKLYFQVLENCKVYQQSLPTKWPSMLPNFSTNDGQPLLTIANADDHMEVVKAYLEFNLRMNN